MEHLKEIIGSITLPLGRSVGIVSSRTRCRTRQCSPYPHHRARLLDLLIPVAPFYHRQSMQFHQATQYPLRIRAPTYQPHRVPTLREREAVAVNLSLLLSTFTSSNSISWLMYLVKNLAPRASWWWTLKTPPPSLHPPPEPLYLPFSFTISWKRYRSVIQWRVSLWSGFSEPCASREIHAWSSKRIWQMDRRSAINSQ